MVKQVRDGLFRIGVPIEFHAKLKRLARGGMRSMGATVGVLISQADEWAPEWNRRPLGPTPARDPEAEAVPAGEAEATP